jgi:hypothetical protein
MTAAAADSAALARSLEARAFPLPLLAALLVALLLGLLMLDQRQRAWTAPDTVDLVIAGEHYRVPAAEAGLLRRLAAAQFAAGGMADREALAAELDRRLDLLFGQLHEQLPVFADWYWSLPGEYTRLGAAALALAGRQGADAVTTQATRILFDGVAWDAQLAALDADLARQAAERERERREGWVAGLVERLSPYRVPAPLAAALAPEDPRQLVRLDPLLASIATAEQARLERRITASTAAAVGASATPALLRATGARQAGRAVAARGTARSSAALGGAALCAPGGPAAIACGLLAFGATWIITDLALLELDEWRHREALLAELSAGLDRLHAELRGELATAWSALLLEHEAGTLREIEAGFVPVCAGYWAANAAGRDPQACRR